MNRVLYDILNNVNEGIIILDQNLNVCFWNNYMEVLTEIENKKANGNNIYDILPNLNKKYFKEIINDALNNKVKMFFSAAMHKGLVNNEKKLNFKISSLQKNEARFLLLEFIDVTNKFAQIYLLKDYIKELHRINIELKEKEKVIKNLAYYDKLTGVANRTLFYEITEKHLEDMTRENKLLGLIFIDIDKFKDINDTYGQCRQLKRK
ncbi:diguanylate cyclase [Clostridium sp. BJN0001]|uniref:sensor domain-containing diguanylate cyclase n=1 Tax=Clostridium sp. BJN0001 TaxID=2930219 RepID=UPI001FD13CFD|nr:diguanylate cyclase [Clostridium sp. BJN0001]